MDNRARNSVLTLFCAYMAFVLAGLYFYNIVDDSPFVPAMMAHWELAIPWLVVEGTAVIALAAVCIGGFPIGLAVLRHALAARRRDLAVLLFVPVLVLGVWVAYGALMVAFITGIIPFPLETRQLAVGEPLPPGNQLLGMVGVGLIALGILASAAAICVAVLRTPVYRQEIHLRGLDLSVQPFSFARLPSVATALAMGVMLAGTLAWGLVARAEVPRVFNDSIGSWLGIVVVMAVSTALAALSLSRGAHEEPGQTQAQALDESGH